MGSPVYLVTNEALFWDSETFASREEAIEYGAKQFEGTFWTGIRGTSPEPAITVNDLEYLFEQKNEEYERPDEMELWPEASDQAMAELAKEMSVVLRSWLERHSLMPTWWSVKGVAEHVSEECN